MVRVVLYESNFAERFSSIAGFHCGVLLGGLADDEEHLFLPIEVPPKEDVPGARANTDREPKSISEIDDKWVASHYKNVLRMIPGGVRISGICVVATMSDFNLHQEHMKKIFMRLPRPESLVVLPMDFNPTEYILLLVDPVTKKFTAMVFDVGLPGVTFRSVAVKQRPFLNYYRAFKTYISLSLETILPADRQKEEILHKLQAAAKPYLQSLLTDANLLVDGEVRVETERVLAEESDAVSPNVPGKKHKKTDSSHRSRSGLIDFAEVKRATDSRGERSLESLPQKSCTEKGSWASVDLAIFGPQFPRWQRASSSSSLESGTSSETGFTAGGGSADGTESSSGGFVPINRLVVSGRIPGIAFLPYNATVQTLFQALQMDLIRGVLARLELLTEELHITSAEFEVPRMLLPQRVLVRLPACPSLPLSDYKFISETADDVVSRLHYFCVPMGVHPTGDVTTGAADHASSIDAHTLSHSQGLNLPASPRDHIDASCLDTSLERSPEVSGDEFSDADLLEEAGQTVQPVTQFMSSSNPTFWLISCAAILLAILFSFALIGWRDHSSN